MPVLLRPCSLTALWASLYLSPPLRALFEFAVSVECVPQPKLREIRAVVQCLLCSAVPTAAPPRSPFMALLIDPWLSGHRLAYNAVLQFSLAW